MNKKMKGLQRLFSATGDRKNPQPDGLSLPTGLLGLTPYLALRGQEELEIFGCVSILCYEDRKILLKMSKGYLRIRGRGLSMRTYHRSSMTVGGEIWMLDFPKNEKDAIASDAMASDVTASESAEGEGGARNAPLC